MVLNKEEVTRVEQLEDSIKALNISLEPEDIVYVEQSYESHNIVGFE